MRIIAGRLKGLIIPFTNAKFDNANATPQKVKEALLSILGKDLSGKSFLDLYACSGQIGIEALSRGAKLVVLNEIDPKRYNFIKFLIERWDLKDNSMVFNLHAFRCLRILDSKNIKFDYIYIDPPYYKKNNENKQYCDILKKLGKYSILKDEGKIIIQHFCKTDLEEIVSCFRLIDKRRYAKNSLSFFCEN